MPKFTGKLNSNKIFAAIYNMIISQQVFADNISGLSNSLVDKARTDGGMLGDTKLYYSTDALASSAWGNDAEAANLLALHRPSAPSIQAISIDTFRQIAVTVDNYLSKQAFADEGAFSAFNAVTKGWIRDTKRVYDHGTYNCFIGTEETAVGKQELTISGVKKATPADIDAAAYEGLLIGDFMADLAVELKDYSRDYNDYGYLRAIDGLTIIWNSKYANRVRKIDLPTIFHKDGIVDVSEDVMPAKYFGTVNSGTKVGDGSTVRSLIEQTIGKNHYFPGELIKTTDTAPAGTSYTEDDTIIFKVVGKLPPLMSGFEVGTSFFNSKSLTENQYLTWGHNTLEHLSEYPFITVRTEA